MLTASNVGGCGIACRITTPSSRYRMPSAGPKQRHGSQIPTKPAPAVRRTRNAIRRFCAAALLGREIRVARSESGRAELARSGACHQLPGVLTKPTQLDTLNNCGPCPDELQNTLICCLASERLFGVGRAERSIPGKRQCTWNWKSVAETRSLDGERSKRLGLPEIVTFGEE